jgi:hypothetical protein
MALHTNDSEIPLAPYQIVLNHHVVSHFTEFRLNTGATIPVHLVDFFKKSIHLINLSAPFATGLALFQTTIVPITSHKSSTLYNVCFNNFCTKLSSTVVSSYSS